MLCLLLVASFVLPSVLGECCLPDKMFAVIYRAGEMSNATLLSDFTKNRSIVRPSEGTVKYQLNDLKDMRTYTRFLDGSCTYEKIQVPFSQCTPKEATEFATVTFAGQLVNTYYIKDDSGNSATTMFTKSCHPMVMVTVEDEKVTTNVITAVTSTVCDTKDLDQKVDDCAQKA